MDKHTPGPWEVRTAGHGSSSGGFTLDEFYVWTAAHDDIALCSDVVDSMGHPSEANARLIAAAPRLLAECEENSAVLMALLAHLNGVANEKVCASIRERISATEDAIAKATGEQP